MSLYERVQRLDETAKITDSFSHSNKLRKLYNEFLEACRKRDKAAAENLVNKMGF